MFDGDYAGREALKTGQALLQQGLNVYVIQLPSGMDLMNTLANMEMRLLNFVAKDKRHLCCLKWSHIKMKLIIMI